MGKNLLLNDGARGPGQVIHPWNMILEAMPTNW